MQCNVLCLNDVCSRACKNSVDVFYFFYKIKILSRKANTRQAWTVNSNLLGMKLTYIFSYYNNRESHHTSQNTSLFLENLPVFKGEKLNQVFRS